jgi:hypothetical protein
MPRRIYQMKIAAWRRTCQTRVAAWSTTSVVGRVLARGVPFMRVEIPFKVVVDNGWGGVRERSRACICH